MVSDEVRPIKKIIVDLDISIQGIHRPIFFVGTKHRIRPNGLTKTCETGLSAKQVYEVRGREDSYGHYGDGAL